MSQQLRSVAVRVGFLAFALALGNGASAMAAEAAPRTAATAAPATSAKVVASAPTATPGNGSALPAPPAPPAISKARAPTASGRPERMRAIVPSGPPPQIMPVSEIRAGMVGEAHTVFRGTRPEAFKVRVVSVVRNFLPKQDVILVKAEDPRVEFSGIAAGMSGSPVYIDGKLIGAVAYAWAFAKEPLAGVTPIEAMLAERGRPRRATRSLVESGELVNGPGSVRGEVSQDSSLAPDGGPGGAPASLTAWNATSSPDGLRPVSVPLSISGVSHQALTELTSALAPFGLVPVRTGGGGGGGVSDRISSEEQARLVPGAAVGVQLIRGDMNATAVGTVTWVNGDSVVAFGHPMFGVGEVSLPLVTGEVHTFINSQASSFKLATPLVEVGAVVQDRPSCIIADLGLRATMMPVQVKVAAPAAESRIFRAEVARNKKLSPILASTVLMTAIADAEPDQTEMAVSLTTRVGLRGMKPIELRDQVFTADGLSPRALSGLRGVRALTELLSNPFSPVAIDRLEFDVQVEFRRDVAEIIAVGLPGDEVRAGDTVPLRVTLRPYAGREYVETVPVVIPERLAGREVRLEVASGSLVRPDLPRAETLNGFIENLRSYYTASSIVVSLSLPEDGASLRGHLIPTLPASALDTLRTASQTRRADSYRVADRTVVSSARLVSGRQELTLQVREDSLGRNR